MQQVISKDYINKGKNNAAKKQQAITRFNLWLDKIGKILNTSQLSNYK
jgi:hypothetical protein